MAARTTHSHAKECLTGGTQNVIEIVIARQRTICWLIIPYAETIKTGGSYRVARLVRHFIASDLFHDEPVVRLVLIKSADHVITILPNEVFFAVALVAVRLGEADEI